MMRSLFLSEVVSRFGDPRRLPDSQSLFELSNGKVRIYIRYSALHQAKKTFFGLRTSDLKQLQGSNSFICFLWEGQQLPLLVPYADFEDILTGMEPAQDGQLKVQVLLGDSGLQLYLARRGRYNVEDYLGWRNLQEAVVRPAHDFVPELTHGQIQTLLGAIGRYKGYDVWIPLADRNRLDWSLTDRFECRPSSKVSPGPENATADQIDVAWFRRGSADLCSLFEVEHTTTIYSGLIRFNDILLSNARVSPTFTIVANERRRAVFLRHVQRPTFEASGLASKCSFLDYGNVFGWYKRLTNTASEIVNMESEHVDPR